MDTKEIERSVARNRFFASLSKEHRQASFENYKIVRFSDKDGNNRSNESAITKIRNYADREAEMIAHGVNVVLYGEPGTGKDHLLVATGRQWASRHSVLFVSGVDLWIQLNATHRQHPADVEGETESDVIDQLVEPDVLILSDVFLRGQALTDARMMFLHAVLNKRLGDGKVTWSSVNIATAEELRTAIGAATTDRLVGNVGLTIPCDWPTYRRKAIASLNGAAV